MEENKNALNELLSKEEDFEFFCKKFINNTILKKATAISEECLSFQKAVKKKDLEKIRENCIFLDLDLSDLRSLFADSLYYYSNPEEDKEERIERLVKQFNEELSDYYVEDILKRGV